MRNTPNVKDLMNPDIMTVADEMTTDELARYLIEREISGAPVVDRGAPHRGGVHD
jgi:predicted transcriptional regulator